MHNVVLVSGVQQSDSYVHSFLYSHMHAHMHPLWLGHAQIFGTLWTIACQALQSMGFSRQDYWSELLFLSPGDLPDPGIEPESPVSPAPQVASVQQSSLCYSISRFFLLFNVATGSFSLYMWLTAFSRLLWNASWVKAATGLRAHSGHLGSGLPCALGPRFSQRKDHH
ncbi:unnamed protein product [Rangifer tarandus platyrhynchus]|uniref:Uncharacterized protein n=1 Tax=Rangifer tarandus platyrhynchus TaxID=3082113 RepID=A0AC59YGM9_RANTA